MQKKLFAGITALTLAATIIPSTFAFGGFGPREGDQKFNPENREAIETAIEAEDFSAFVEATGNSNLTQEKFETMLERHAEMEIKRAENEAAHEAIQAAVEAGDYETWTSLIAEKNPDAPILEKITAENFSQLQELHELRGEMKTIQEELGLNGKDFGHKGGTQRGNKHGGQGIGGSRMNQ
ncbi:hypothetical protein K9N08_00790 [Candidatus Gracilibacteria bacterium]|nr:hypothetical protein [Candidatus Gracilibacteria bacterium]MCF7856080.1 hypothetical protein [Candidatus Gracilibacteria bacterium]MCF7896499.1 hypothetical protein [Candidatus Gracilibacteria bacterium]